MLTLRQLATIAAVILLPQAGMAMAQDRSAAPHKATPAQVQPVPPADAPAEYTLGPGDSIRIQVFQNQDLTLETRVSESGFITYPLIGAVKIGGLAISQSEARIAKLLEDGGFVIKPQVTVYVLQIRGNSVSVLGQFNRPGRFPLETTQTRLSDAIALAGGIMPTGSDTVVLVGVREGRPFRKSIDVPAIFMDSKSGTEDIPVISGDVVYVHRAPQVYIYGEVQRPGNFRLERDMTVMQALAVGGGLTPKGTQRHIRVHRRAPDGSIKEIEPKLDDPVQPDDVVYVRESVF